ncbi:MAG: hypothetical protein D4R90_02015 [Nitrosopumilales archaeon]|nr:MAG: hypothetical protein D4R90_02015 [Nitrosopumilales archaeon]
MLSKITIEIPPNKSLEMELDSSLAPNTVKAILDNLPISVTVHVWGEELYTDPIPIVVKKENSKPLVSLLDVAYWPPGQAICLFFGPTPIGNKGEIKPYSPVNVIGKIISKDIEIPINLDGKKITFRLSC